MNKFQFIQPIIRSNFKYIYIYDSKNISVIWRACIHRKVIKPTLRQLKNRIYISKSNFSEISFQTSRIIFLHLYLTSLPSK